MLGMIQSVTHLVAYERTKIDMLYDESYPFDILIEPCTLRSKETYSVLRLVLGKRHKSGEECDREKDRDEIRHGISASRDVQCER